MPPTLRRGDLGADAANTVGDSRSPASGAVHTELDKLNPYQSEPLLNYFARHRTPPSLLLLVVVLLLALPVLAAGIDGTLLVPDVHTWVSDSSVLLLFGKAQSTSASISLLRDYTALSVVISAGLTVPLMYLNSRFMNRLVTNLVTRGSDRLDPQEAATLKACIAGLNNGYARTGRLSILYIIASALMAWCLYLTLANPDSFRRLVSAGSQRATIDWWASYQDGHILSFIVWMAVGSISVYIYLKNNAMGYGFLYFFWKTRTLRWYGVDELNQDGFYGWLELRKLLISVYLAIMLSGLAALCYLSNLNAVIVGPSLLVLWVLLVLALSIPALGITPLVLLKRVIARYQTERADVVRAQFVEAVRELPNSSPQYLEAMEHSRARMTMVREVRPRLFRPFTLVIALVVYIIPVASLILTVASTFHWVP